MNLRDKSAVVAGLGNIGSTLPALLLQAGVGKVTLIDRDTVEAKNLAAQDYRPEDVGRAKVDAIADRLRARFPEREIIAITSDLEDVPVGALVADVTLGALDSRRARQVLHADLAFPLGVPLVDGGVGDGGLGRVQVFAHDADSACLECTWGSADYRLLASEYPCLPGAEAVGVPTGAPAWLGAMTAALMASVAVKILTEGVGECHEIAFDAKNSVMRRFSLKRNCRCRFDHARPTACASVRGANVSTGAVRLEGNRRLGRFLTPEALPSLAFRPGDRVRLRDGERDLWLIPEEFA